MTHRVHSSAKHSSAEHSSKSMRGEPNDTHILPYSCLLYTLSLTGRQPEPTKKDRYQAWVSTQVCTRTHPRRSSRRFLAFIIRNQITASGIYQHGFQNLKKKKKITGSGITTSRVSKIWKNQITGSSVFFSGPNFRNLATKKKCWRIQYRDF